MRKVRDQGPSLRSLNYSFISRRSFLVAFAGALGVASSKEILLSVPARSAVHQDALAALPWTELTRVLDDKHHVAQGYRADVVIAWGDALKPGIGIFDPGRLDAASQANRFGYNCDFIAFMPLPRGSQSAEHGLLCVNNETASPELMSLNQKASGTSQLTKEQVALCNMAIGHSIIEVQKQDKTWVPLVGSPYNRRITLDTECLIAGPCAGHDWMKTSHDPKGTMVRGTANNCAGGVTPWGTVLSCEEGAQGLFGGNIKATPFPELLARYHFDGKDRLGRAQFDERFNVEKEPNEPNRFHWVVEINPYEPQSVPVKRTALGRMAHEGATVVVNKDGRIVVYMGDDANFEYIYRFVSIKAYDASQPSSANRLLDEGVLSVARFNSDGTMNWLPLVYGRPPLTADRGFGSQADVLLKTRLAADALGATPMDSPEDIEANPVTGRVYAVMTKNNSRLPFNLNAANPRWWNHYGHILELSPRGGVGRDADHTGDVYDWAVFVLAGNHRNWLHGATFHTPTSENGWFVNPDNLAFDPKGRLFVATDGGNEFGIPDGIYGMATEGPDRGLSKLLFSCPVGAEASGPCFTSDGKTLFVSVQGPGAKTHWPDFKAEGPSRPAVVAIQRLDGGDIGG